MGQYTEHWSKVKRQSLSSTLHALLVLAVGLPAIAGLGYLLSPLDDLRTAFFLLVIVCWLVLFTTVILRGTRVLCPRCDTKYSRGKYLVNCPKCGLRMYQDAP